MPCAMRSRCTIPTLPLPLRNLFLIWVTLLLRPAVASTPVQTCLFQLPLESAKGSKGFSGSKVSISTVYVITDIIDPSLQSYSRMFLNQSPERSVEDELGDCWSLRAALKNAFFIMARSSIDAFGLDGSGPSIKVQGKLEMQRRVSKFPGWLNDLVKVNMIVEAGEVC